MFFHRFLPIPNFPQRNPHIFLQARASVNEKATPKQYLCTKIAIFAQN